MRTASRVRPSAVATTLLLLLAPLAVLVGPPTTAVAAAPQVRLTTAATTSTSTSVAHRAAPSRRFERRVLRRVNRLRAAGITCGDRDYRPRRALRRNGALTAAAGWYARRMAVEGFFSHTAPDGSTFADRATAAGYDWRRIGENIAAGQDTPAEVVRSWRRSVGHCHNMMGRWRHLGVGHVERPRSAYGDYWVQMFGTPA